MLKSSDLQKLLEEKRYSDLYILARYYYRYGFPIISDSTYDDLHKVHVEYNLLSDYISRTYDDDPVPVKLLMEFNLSPISSTSEDIKDNPYYDFLVSRGTFSINAVTEYIEIKNFVDAFRGRKLQLSLKVDGIKIRNALADYKLQLSLSRGRNGADPWSCTDKMNLVIGDKISTLKDLIPIEGEAFVDFSSLDFLRDFYDKDKPAHEKRFKTSRTAATSMLRTNMEPSHYKFVKFLAFSADGLADSPSKTFKALEDLGFDTPPYFTIDTNDAPEDIDSFVMWMRNHLDKMRELQGNIPADGVVLEVDDYSISPEVKGAYMSTNIAIKLEHWSHQYYVGEVEEIIETPKGVTFSYRAKIKEFVTNDNTTAKIINLFNPDLMMKEMIVPGARIYFERNSGAVNVMLHGERKPISAEIESVEVGTLSNSFGGE